MCNSGCHCRDCINTKLNDDGHRRAIEAIIGTNPGVFCLKFVPALVGLEHQQQRPEADEVPHLPASTATMSCTCQMSRCLKLYCQCFSSSTMCNSGCRCLDCMNTELNDGGRRRTIEAIIATNPGVFSPPPTAAPPPPTSATTATPSCTCHRGRCLKLYCQCFSSSAMTLLATAYETRGSRWINPSRQATTEISICYVLCTTVFIVLNSS